MPIRESAELRLRKLTEAENGLRDLGPDFIDPSDAPPEWVRTLFILIARERARVHLFESSDLPYWIRTLQHSERANEPREPVRALIFAERLEEQLEKELPKANKSGRLRPEHLLTWKALESLGNPFRRPLAECITRGVLPPIPPQAPALRVEDWLWNWFDGATERVIRESDSMPLTVFHLDAGRKRLSRYLDRIGYAPHPLDMSIREAAALVFRARKLDGRANRKQAEPDEPR